MIDLSQLKQQPFCKGIVSKIEPFIIEVNPLQIPLVAEVATMEASNPRILFNMVEQYAHSIMTNGFDKTKPMTIGLSGEYFLVDGETRLRSLLLLQMYKYKDIIIKNIPEFSVVYSDDTNFKVNVNKFNKLLSVSHLNIRMLRTLLSQHEIDLTVTAFVIETSSADKVYEQMLNCNLQTQKFNHHELAELAGRILSSKSHYPEWVKNLFKSYGVGERRLKTLFAQYKLSHCCKKQWMSLTEKDATSITRYVVDTYSEYFIIPQDKEICDTIIEMIRLLHSDSVVDKEAVELILRGKRSKKKTSKISSVDGLNVDTSDRTIKQPNRESLPSILHRLLGILQDISDETHVVFSDVISDNMGVTTLTYEQYKVYCSTNDSTVLPKQLTTRLDWLIILSKIETILEIYKPEVLQTSNLFTFIKRYNI